MVVSPFRLGPLENNNQAKETTTIKERATTHELIIKDKLKKPFDKCDANGDGDREETKADCLGMTKSIAKLSGQPVDKFLPNIERKLDHSPDVTKKPRARWILIKLRHQSLAKANSTHFHKWAVVKTTDENYPQIVGDIQAYEVFEKQEPVLDRGKKAGLRSTKTSPRNHKITETTTKITATYRNEETFEQADGAPLGEATGKQQESETKDSKTVGVFIEKTPTIQREEQLNAETTRAEAASQTSIEAVITSPNMHKTLTTPIKQQVNEERPVASPHEISTRATTHENNNKDASHLHNETPSMVNEDEITAATLN